MNRIIAWTTILVSTTMIVACGGGGGGGDGGVQLPTTFTIGGTASGLMGTGLVLRNNGGDNLAVTANGAFTFATATTSL